MILADTSVWIDHLRRRRRGLAELLYEGRVVCHPFVAGEIALGTLTNRIEVLELLAELPSARVVSHGEVLNLVERRMLSGKGVGWIDVHLLASALIDRVQIWTLDRRLGDVARELDIAWEE